MTRTHTAENAVMEEFQLVDLDVLSLTDDRFEMLPLSARQRVEVGELAELVYLGARGAEHLWAEVIERTAAGYRGCLDGSSRVVRALSEGAIVDFSASNVLRIYQRQAMGES